MNTNALSNAAIKRDASSKFAHVKLKTCVGGDIGYRDGLQIKPAVVDTTYLSWCELTRLENVVHDIGIVFALQWKDPWVVHL